MTPFIISGRPSDPPHRVGSYQRLGTVPLDVVFEAIRSPAKQAMVLGTEVGVDSLRLQTFATHAPCCSNPECDVVATHFAVERSFTKDPERQHQQAWHLNLYGRTSEGREVLLTHDHTLARALGGADVAENTTTMCLPCNTRKSVWEHRLVRERRAAQGLPANHSTKGLNPTEPTSEESLQKVLAQARRLFDDMTQVRGMKPTQYRIHCEAMGQAFALARKPARQNARNKLQAEAVGLSEDGYRFLRHDHNEHQKQMRQGLEASDHASQKKNCGQESTCIRAPSGSPG